MDERKFLSVRFARAATLVAMCCVFGSGYVSAAPHSRIGELMSRDALAPTDAFCRANNGSPCYSPQEMRTAYGVNGLIDAGFDGKGQTIVIIDSYGSPTIAADLAAFDAGYGLPDPPSLTVLAPFGTVPFDPLTIPHLVAWANETTLDVEWAHAMAPGAAIVVLTSPVDEYEGVQGMPEFLALEQYALDHHLGQIISQSWSTTENTLFADAAGPQGPQVIADFSAFYARAAEEQVTVLSATGDTGSSNPGTDGAVYPFPTVGFPASSPLVTAVGGTTLNADTSGNYQSEAVWNSPGCCAGGGGLSQIFQQPFYQQWPLPTDVRRQLGGMRGIPDVSYTAVGILVYQSYVGSSFAGYYAISGTSVGPPQWAGIVADLNQYAGRPLGFLNPSIYARGSIGGFGSFRDITVGNNALTGFAGAVTPGYSAEPGWDLASGWGTPNLAGLPTPPNSGGGGAVDLKVVAGLTLLCLFVGRRRRT